MTWRKDLECAAQWGLWAAKGTGGQERTADYQVSQLLILRGRVPARPSSSLQTSAPIQLILRLCCENYLLSVVKLRRTVSTAGLSRPPRPQRLWALIPVSPRGEPLLLKGRKTLFQLSFKPSQMMAALGAFRQR